MGGLSDGTHFLTRALHSRLPWLAAHRQRELDGLVRRFAAYAGRLLPAPGPTGSLLAVLAGRAPTGEPPTQRLTALVVRNLALSGQDTARLRAGHPRLPQLAGWAAEVEASGPSPAGN